MGVFLEFEARLRGYFKDGLIRESPDPSLAVEVIAVGISRFLSSALGIKVVQSV
jgi:hypothetical protein